MQNVTNVDDDSPTLRLPRAEAFGAMLEEFEWAVHLKLARRNFRIRDLRDKHRALVAANQGS